MLIDMFVNDFEIIGCALLAAVLGGVIGWEREKHHTIVASAGIRTYSAIALGACVFGSIGYSLPGNNAYIAAQVVTGIGFLGGGIIFREGDYTFGLTTAATLWATAAVGLAIAFKFYLVGMFVAFIIYLLLYLSRLPWWKRVSAKSKKHLP
ncbi:MAG: hypothetical protein A3F43_01765 [Gammaproteobacteria bacterium RIFCSPHIGHO2_12_FULL_42_10]|nr:MAG: hypothetical protein A3F43_01765 [Gammaproteobacteria bacterium RIFCSPHIGHO2_12_FULL_42_10]